MGARRGCSEAKIRRVEVVHTGPQLVHICAQLRADCEAAGHLVIPTVALLLETTRRSWRVVDRASSNRRFRK